MFAACKDNCIFTNKKLDTFLQQVAHYVMHAYRDKLKDLTLVFPNRRSIVFFMQACKNSQKEPCWLPKMVTISDYLKSYAGLQLGAPIALLFELYRVYKSVSGSEETFDQFFHWGEVLVKDFDDVDKYLVQPEAIFTNIKDWRAMDNPADYLTEEQVAVLQQFFRSFSLASFTDLQQSFLQVWEVLLPVYAQYNKNLAEKGYAYEGALFKKAAECIGTLAKDELVDTVFIGFNAVTTCERVVFSHLQKQGKASFFWDYDPLYVEDRDQEAGMFLRKYLKEYPMPEDFELQSALLDPSKKIRVLAASSDHGQIEVASQLIAESAVENHAEVALVLANEELLFPALNSLPAKVEKVNATMGYPAAKGNVGSFIELLFALHQNVRVAKSGEIRFYHVYVSRLLQHSFVRQFYAKEARELMAEIVEANQYYVGMDVLARMPMADLLFFHAESVPVFQQKVKLLFQSLLERLLLEADTSRAVHMDVEMLYEALKAHNQLAEELQVAQISLELRTYARVYLKLLQSIRVPFEGEPLNGLQLMGFLETRNLDFKEVIIVSVNEGQLPLSQARVSFIPYSLRKGFALPVKEMHDAMYAYYFYRLLQRAGQVTLIYNAGTSGMETGEKSRFAFQLMFDPRFKVESSSTLAVLESSPERENQVEKSAAVQKLLQRYVGAGDRKSLSPSALVRYMTCPLKFYYYSLLRLYEQDEVEEQVDARIFGNIFHKSTELIYAPFVHEGKVLEAADFNRLLQKDFLQGIIQEAFRDSFRLGERYVEMEGKNVLVESVLEIYLKQLLEKDKESIPLQLLHTEGVFFAPFAFESAGQKLEVTLGGTIDRVDRVAAGVRIIDYKTGSDKTSFAKLEDVFGPSKIKDHKAILQTFIYALVYADLHPEEKVILPAIMQVRKLFLPHTEMQISATKDERFSGNFKDIAVEVRAAVQAILAEIFDPNIPFGETQKKENCGYCAYKVLCGKK